MKNFILVTLLTLGLVQNVIAETIYFPDANFARAVRNQIGLPPDAPVTDQDMLLMTEIIIDGHPIYPVENIEGIQYATNMEMFLYTNGIRNGSVYGFEPISDFAPLADLSNLEILAIVSSYIYDIKPLLNFPNLDRLALFENPRLYDIVGLLDNVQMPLDVLRIEGCPLTQESIDYLAEYGFIYSEPASVELMGDANRDGFVDRKDILILMDNFNKVDPYFETGDFNSDNVVNFKDLSIIQSNLSMTTILVVPEPHSIIIFVIGLLCIFFIKKGRKCPRFTTY